MAFLKYRGSTTAPGTWTSSAAANAPLTNLDIDKNFASLDSQKLDLTGGTITGALAIGQNLTAEFKDDQVAFVDGTDTSKKLALQLSGITTSTTRTLTVPNQNGTIALTSDILAPSDTLATVTGRGATTATALSITNNTASTSTSTGALVVTGGVGIGGALVVGGNLTVNGTTTTVNSTTVTVDDKNIELGSVASPTNITADGGGITLKGDTDKTFNWIDSTSAWTSSEDLNLLTGKQYEINGTPVLNSTTLGSGVVNSSLTKIGTATAGFVKSDATGNLTVDTSTYLTSFTDTLQTIADDTTTDATYYPSFVTATTGDQTAKVSSTKLTFNPSTGTLAATNFDSLSDSRYKKDFKVITDALSKVTQLTGYTYTLIESDKRSTGLTAQEVEQVLPEAVTDGDRKTLNYGSMMGLIVEALKELNAKVDKLQNQLMNK